MLDKSTERILKRMDRMGFAGAGEALREIARLRDVIDRAAQAWLSLDPPLQWEGDVGDAMVAAVAEIARLREERAEIYAKYQLERGELLTEIERLRGAIRTHKDNVWGVTTIEHEEDKKLYETIDE